MKSNFSIRLSKLRREAGYSQRQAATDLGVSQALLSHYENGAREPKLEFIIKACDYYDVTVDHILGRSDAKPKNALPTTDSCDNAPRLISAVNDVFSRLNTLADAELYAAAVGYMVIPVENVAALLHEPDTQYDPVRDAELKMAEARFLARAKSR